MHWARKRGLSDIVVTVLMILLAIGAISIVWGFVKEFASSGAGDITTQCTTLDLQPISCSYDTSTVTVKYGRNAGAATLTNVSLIFEVNGNSQVQSATSSGIPNVLETKLQSLPLTALTGNPSKFSIAGTVTTEGGKSKLCSTSSTIACQNFVAASCQQILSAGQSIGSGVYTIDPDGSAGPTAPFSTYCDMTTNGGGWTLVMKADGTQSTFGWAANYWTTNNVYNTANTAFDLTEAKLNSYNTVPFTAVLVRMRDPSNGNINNLQITQSASSMYNLISTGTYTATTVGRNTWKGLLSSSSLQPNCNQEGFNVECPVGGAGSWVKERLGILGNNENDCGTCDSKLGIGGTGDACGVDVGGATTVGNAAGCGGDNGDKNIKAFAYIFVR